MIGVIWYVTDLSFLDVSLSVFPEQIGRKQACRSVWKCDGMRVWMRVVEKEDKT